MEQEPRLIFLLSNTLAHTVISLEDDVIVKREAWQDHWVEMCNQYGHCTWADRNVVASKADRLILGSGTAIDPYLLKFVSGQVMSFSRTAIESAGYFDPKFRGYGYEHIDLSRRLHRLGFGFKDIKDESGRTVRGYVNIEGGIEITELPTVSDRSSVEENRRIYEDLKNDHSFRNPWKDGVERQIFLDEIASSVEYPIEAVRSSV